MIIENRFKRSRSRDSLFSFCNEEKGHKKYLLFFALLYFAALERDWEYKKLF